MARKKSLFKMTKHHKLISAWKLKELEYFYNNGQLSPELVKEFLYEAERLHNLYMCIMFDAHIGQNVGKFDVTKITELEYDQEEWIQKYFGK